MYIYSKLFLSLVFYSYISVPRTYNVNVCRHSAGSTHLRCIIVAPPPPSQPHTTPAPQPATRRQHLSVSLLKKHKPETQDSTKRTCSEERWRRDTFFFFFRYIYKCFTNVHMFPLTSWTPTFFSHINAIIDNWYEYEIYCRILPLFLTAPAPLYLHFTFGFFTFPVKSTGYRISILSAWASDGHLDSARCSQPLITRQKKRTRAVDAHKVHYDY